MRKNLMPIFLLIVSTLFFVSKVFGDSNSIEGCEAQAKPPQFVSDGARPEIANAKSGPLLATRSGEEFLAVSQSNQTGLYEFTSKNVKFFEQGAFEDSSALFESRIGKVFFSYVTLNSIKIFDGRSGVLIYDKTFSEIPQFGDLLTQTHSSSAIFRPIFYEDYKGVHVVLVPRNPEFYLEPASIVPILTISLRSKKTHVDPIHAGVFNYSRASNGKVYAMGWERNAEGASTTLLVRDLTTGTNVLREEFVHTQDVPKLAGEFSLFFSNTGQAELVQFSPPPVSKVFYFDRVERKFVSIPGVSLSNVVNIKFFREHDGAPWFAAITRSEGKSLERYHLVIQPLMGFTGAVDRALPLLKSENAILDLDIVDSTVTGRVVVAWERAPYGKHETYARAHFLKLKDRSQVVYALPPEWVGPIDRQTIIGSKNGVLNFYFSRNANEESLVGSVAL